jgi:hypothetical protein
LKRCPHRLSSLKKYGGSEELFFWLQFLFKMNNDAFCSKLFQIRPIVHGDFDGALHAEGVGDYLVTSSMAMRAHSQRRSGL